MCMRDWIIVQIKGRREWVVVYKLMVWILIYQFDAVE